MGDGRIWPRHNAAIWADPYRWIPEAARILRPDGELVFLDNGTFWVLTVPETDDEGPAADRLLRPYFGMHRFDWAGQSGVEFAADEGIGGFESMPAVDVLTDAYRTSGPVGRGSVTHSNP
jgi:SAM-dependent methyltransferase